MADESENVTRAPELAEDELGPLPVGFRVGRYIVDETLGKGGFGITYRAHDSQLGRAVAIKEYMPVHLAARRGDQVVMPRSTRTAEAFVQGRARFLAEARTLALLEGVTGVVNVHDFLAANGTAYLVMEFVRGETLDRLLARVGTLDEMALRRLLDPLLDGLERVHAAGFLHRDIKPSNILIDETGRPKLIDFGAAREALRGHSGEMTAIHTPGYAPLEQLTTSRQGPWTDIYALAATLYHCVAGKPPPDVLERMVEDELVPAVEAGRGRYDAAFLGAIDAGLTIKMENRPRSIADWAAIRGADVRPAASPTPAPQPMPGPAPRLAARRNPWLALSVAAAVLGASAVAVWLAVMPPGRDDAAANRERVVAEEKARQEAAARERAEAEAKAQREADEKARQAAVRERAEAEAKAQREAQERERQEAEAKARRDADAAEQALRLSDEQRRRVQAGLTIKGFDVGTPDGAFGARTRRMIADWQRSRGEPATGFLTAAQHAALIRETEQAYARQQEDQRRTELERGKAAADAQQPSAVPSPPAPPGVGKFDGVWTGVLSNWTITLTVIGESGQLSMVDCRGTEHKLRIRIAPDGRFDDRPRFGGDQGSSWITGFLPSFAFHGSNACPGGTVTLARGERERAKAPVDVQQPRAVPPPPASSDVGKVDGVWVGVIGNWTITLTVVGDSGQLAMVGCSGRNITTKIRIAPDGSFDNRYRIGTDPGSSWIRGRLPSFALDGSLCPGGSGTLTRSGT